MTLLLAVGLACALAARVGPLPTAILLFTLYALGAFSPRRTRRH